MGVLGEGLDRIKKFNAARRERSVGRLLSEASRAERSFADEAKRLGISIAAAPPARDYYAVLGIKRNADQKTVRAAYLRLVKQYHPDVSTDSRATQMTEEINGAYAVLKDREGRARYDASLSEGTAQGQSYAAAANEIIKRYSDARNRDFEDFNKRVAVPQQRDSIKAAIEEVADWNKRFNRACSAALGKFWDRGRELERIESGISSLLSDSSIAAAHPELSDAAARLAALVKAYRDAEKGLKSLSEKIRADIATDENNIVDRLRRSVQ